MARDLKRSLSDSIPRIPRLREALGTFLNSQRNPGVRTYIVFFSTQSSSERVLAYLARGHCKLRRIAKVRAYLQRLEAICEVFLRITARLVGVGGMDKSDQRR